MASETEGNSQLDSELFRSVFGYYCSWSLRSLVCIVVVRNWNNKISGTKDFPITIRKIRKRYFCYQVYKFYRFMRTSDLNFCFLRELALPKHPVKSCNGQMLKFTNSGSVKISCWIFNFKNYSFQYLFNSIHLPGQHKNIIQLLTSLLWPQALIRGKSRRIILMLKLFFKNFSRSSSSPKHPTK